MSDSLDIKVYTSDAKTGGSDINTIEKAIFSSDRNALVRPINYKSFNFSSSDKEYSTIQNKEAFIFFSYEKFDSSEILYRKIINSSSNFSTSIHNWVQSSGKDIKSVRAAIVGKIDSPVVDGDTNGIYATRALLKAVKSALSSEEFTRLFMNNTDPRYQIKSVNLIWTYAIPVPVPTYKTTAITIDGSNIFKLKRVEEFNIYSEKNNNNKYIQSIIFDRFSSWNKPGFYYGVGYYQKDGTTAKLINNSDKYIGINSHTSSLCWVYEESEVVSDINTLSSYDYYFQLYNTKPPYYTEVNKTGVPTNPAAGNTGQSQIKLPTFTPLTLNIVDYSTFAETDLLKYIYDFSGYNVKFIPLKDSDIEVETNKTTLTLGIKDTIEGQEVEIKSSPRVRIDTTTITEQELFEILDANMDKLTVKLDIKNKETGAKISLKEYFSDENNRGKYNFVYSENGIDFNGFLKRANNDLKYLENTGYNFKTELSLIQEAGILNLRSLELFEAFTRGRDFIEENYTIVRPKERNPEDLDNETSRCMSYDENYFTYKYSGRNIDLFTHKNKNELCILLQDYKTQSNNNVYCALIHDTDLLLESDVTLGETYGEQEYFIEAIKFPIWEDNDAEIKKETGKYNYKDSFKLTNYLSDDGIDSTIYTEDDLEIITSKIDLLQCQYYYPTDATFENDWCDCRKRINKNGSAAVECVYQKLGYCPYRFKSEKHPRRIRTLQQSKSNRFNLIQELCKVFEFYPYFYIEHDSNGRVKLDKNGQMLKHVFFMTEKGTDKYAGFRYEKNLSNITRTVDSAAITTKLYVESVDSQFSNDGLCSIQTATDNIGQNSYILDFSYYAKIGALDADQLQRDLYGIDKDDFAFLPRIGEYNKLYDKYSNLIITMTGKTLVELMAEITVSTTGVITSLEERKKVGQQMYQFKAATTLADQETNLIKTTYQTSDTYKNYLTKYREQATILWGLVENLLYSNNYFSMPVKQDNGIYSFIVIDSSAALPQEIANKQYNFVNVFNQYRNKYCKGEFLWRLLIEGFEDNDYVPPFDHWEDFTEQIIEPKLYEINGKLGKYRSLYNQVQYWKRERAKILNKINDLSLQFYKKYEPYIKEGAFTDSNYLTDNEYYWGSVSVLNDSCEPKLTYTFNVIDISPLEEFSDDYNYDICDTTYLEDIDFFGINKHTGFPNREKVMISDMTDDLDQPSKNTLSIKNYSSAFSDLFGAITASVQSLTYNENVYKRASNFTAKQYVTTESLQDTLDIGDLTLLDTAKDNIQLDESGTEGNDINNTASQYKITGEGVLFSTDGGETWDVGVGPKGINMDYAKFGNLDASKVQIVDGEYIYFLWDKDGINAYRDPSASVEGLADFARFNKYGLSLIENGNVRLRAGYEFRSNEYGSNMTGDYTKEIALKDQNIGFYLYNDKGQPIFKTETQSDYNDNTTDYSARLSLTGEMFVTNKILDSNSNVSNINPNIIYKKQLSVQYTFKNEKVITVYNENTETSVKETYDLLKNFNNNFKVNNLFILNENNENVNNIEQAKLYTICVVRGNADIDDEETLAQYPNARDITVYRYQNCSFSIINAKTVEETIDIDFVKQHIDDLICEIEVPLNPEEENEEKVKMYKAHNGTTEIKQIIDINANYFQILEVRTYFTIDTINANAAVETENQTLTSQKIQYKVLLNNGGYENQEKSLYLYQNNGELTYWEKYENTTTPIGQFTDDFSLSEVGVFINNKKALRVNSGELEDKTNSDSQQISSDMDQALNANESILSGAERTFMITAGGKDQDGNFVYKNILSVLKNGALYMGGTITDYYGKALDISNLSYMPDEVKINHPSFILTNAGQMWCDWDKFFGITTDENGNWGLTTTSLKNVLDGYNTALNGLNDNINGYFGSLSGIGSGYYIDDPASDQ